MYHNRDISPPVLYCDYGTMHALAARPPGLPQITKCRGYMQLVPMGVACALRVVFIVFWVILCIQLQYLVQWIFQQLGEAP